MSKKSHLAFLVLVALGISIATFQFLSKGPGRSVDDKTIQIETFNATPENNPTAVVPMFITWLGDEVCHITGLAERKDGGWGMTCISETPRQYNFGKLIMVTLEGNIDWEQTFFARDLEISGLMTDIGGNYILVGSDSPTFAERILAKDEGLVVLESDAGEKISYSPEVSANYWLAQVDSSAHEIWRKSYHSGPDHYGCAVVESENDALLVAGTAFIEESGLSFSLMKTNTEGEMLWRQEYPAAGGFLCGKALLNSQGNLLAGGTTGAVLEGMERIMLLKTDATGNLLWQWHDDDHHGSLAALIETTNGNYAFIGQGNPSYIKMIDPSGALQWIQFLADHGVWGMVAAEDGGVLIAGHGSIMGFDSAGNVTLNIKPAGVQITGGIKLLLPDSETVLLAGSGVPEGTVRSGLQGFIALLPRK